MSFLKALFALGGGDSQKMAQMPLSVPKFLSDLEKTVWVRTAARDERSVFMDVVTSNIGREGQISTSKAHGAVVDAIAYLARNKIGPLYEENGFRDEGISNHREQDRNARLTAKIIMDEILAPAPAPRSKSGQRVVSYQ